MQNLEGMGDIEKPDSDDELTSIPAPPWAAGFRIPDPPLQNLDIQKILAGNATFTVENTETGNRYTYKVTAPYHDGKRDFDADVRFVKVMFGPDNEEDYVFLGTIFQENHFRYSRKSSVTPTDIRVVAFRWTFERLLAGTLPGCVNVHHAGNCCRCGRKLTVPTSIEAGIGPLCAGRM